MARVVRVIEYLGTPETLKSWLEHSCADGVSPMFSPHQMIVWTVESDVPEIPVTPAPGTDEWDSRSAISFAGRGRPIVKYEGDDRRRSWYAELSALQALIGKYLGVIPPDYAIIEQDLVALQRVFERVQLALEAERIR